MVPDRYKYWKYVREDREVSLAINSKGLPKRTPDPGSRGLRQGLHSGQRLPKGGTGTPWGYQERRLGIPKPNQ